VEIEDIYNIDETGFQLSQTTANYVVYDPAMGPPVSPAPESNQWATIIECIGVNQAIKPYLIFVGKALEDYMFPKTEELPDIIWAFSPKGWTDNELAVDWLRRIFILKTSKQGKHSILILDNHKSHVTGEFQYYCLKHDIHPLYLPAHATHKLQPPDVGPFSPLSAAYRRLVQDYTPTGFATLDRVVFTKLYTQARQTTLTERNIRAGWKRAGIWPLNKQKVLEDPSVKNFGRTTPEYQPPPVKEGPNHLLATPKKEDELRELILTIEAKVTPRTRRNVRKLGHAAIQERTGAQMLRTELRDIRKQAIEQELHKRSQRLRKEAVQRSWDLEQVRAAREGRAPSRVRITHRSEDSLRIVILSDKLE
jgi:DDE superfamily endonuclease